MSETTGAPILEARSVSKSYAIKKWFRTLGEVKALDDVSFQLQPSETLAVVGESGCGKTTLAKLLMQIEAPNGGEVLMDGKVAASLPRVERLESLQMIFQDPYSSINPRKRSWQIVAEPLQINSNLSAEECRKRASAAMVRVGLRPEHADRFPHMFSGGQRQRLGIARALMMKPKAIICDEPVSALDVSVQAQVLNLLMDLQEEMKLSYLFISHDLSVVRHISDRVLVIYLGRIVEIGSKNKIFDSPKHPYTQTLLASTPKIGTSGALSGKGIQGDLPSPINRPTGCAFHPRCPLATDLCKQEMPSLREVDGREVACHHADEAPAQGTLQ